jgi:hypothetical protein
MLDRTPRRPPKLPTTADKRRACAEKQGRWRQCQRDGIDWITIPVDKSDRAKLTRWGYLPEQAAEERDRRAISAAVPRMLKLAQE